MDEVLTVRSPEPAAEAEVTATPTVAPTPDLAPGDPDGAPVLEFEMAIAPSDPADAPGASDAEWEAPVAVASPMDLVARVGGAAEAPEVAPADETVVEASAEVVATDDVAVEPTPCEAPVEELVEAADETIVAADDATAAVGAEPSAADEPDTAPLERILESLLLAAGQPVPLAKLAEALDGPDRREIALALGRLAAHYDEDRRGLRVIHVAGGWQLRSSAEHGPWVRKLLGGKPPKLTRPMLETLAIVAYRQPCTRPEIEAIRGVDCDAAITSLLERRMVRIEGRKEAPGRPLLYATTREFLEVFGLPDLQALPPLRDLGDQAELLMAADLTVARDGVKPTPHDALLGMTEPTGAPVEAAVDDAAPPVDAVVFAPAEQAVDEAPADADAAAEPAAIVFDAAPAEADASSDDDPVEAVG